MEFALGILAGIVVAALADVLIGFWMAAHRGRIAARVVQAELAGHDLALCRALRVEDLREIPRDDPRRRSSFRSVIASPGDGHEPELPTTAWAEMRSAILETAPDRQVIPLVAWYQPLQDRAMLDSQTGGVVKGFLAAAAAADALAARSRWAGFWFVLRGAPGEASRAA